MRKKDLTVIGAIAEALDIIFSLAYMTLQVYYGISNHLQPIKYIANILVLVLVYVFITWLQLYPEKLIHIDAQICTGRIRKYSLRLLACVKLIFIAGLLVPCVFDAIGIAIRDAYSLIIIGLILVVCLYFGYKIVDEIRNMRNEN